MLYQGTTTICPALKPTKAFLFLQKVASQSYALTILLIVVIPAQAVDPVVLGKVRAKQYYGEDTSRGGTMGILLHGDGAFSGQGIVYETLDMSQLPEYQTGGTVHIVVNNQVSRAMRPVWRSQPCKEICHRILQHLASVSYGI